MAITFKLDEAQSQGLITAINAQTEAVNELSDNLGKWLAQLTGSVDALNSTLGGSTDDQLQTIVNQLAVNLNLSSDEVEAAIKQAQQTKG